MVSVFEKYRSSVLFRSCKRNNYNTMIGVSDFVNVYALLMFLIRRNSILNRRWPEEKLGLLRFMPRNAVLRRLQSVFFMATINNIREALSAGYLEDREIRKTLVCALEARKRSAGQYVYYNDVDEEEEGEENDSEFTQIDGAVPGPSSESVAPSAVPAASGHHHHHHHHHHGIRWPMRNTSDVDEEFAAIFDTPRRWRWLNEQARARMLEDSSSDSSSDASFPSTTSDERERIEAASRKMDEEFDIEILIDELMNEEDGNNDEYSDEDNNDEYSDEGNDEYNDNDYNDDDDYNDEDHNDEYDDEGSNDEDRDEDMHEILTIFGGVEE